MKSIVWFSSLLIAAIFFTNTKAWAQPALPDVATVTQSGVNIITWTSPYDGLKNIAVQRSSDSLQNFTTIGYVKTLSKGTQAYIDGHPLPGNNWYRLYIVFSSDLTWLSNYGKLYVDSATLATARVLPPNDSLQKYINTKSGTVLIPPKGANDSNAMAIEVPNLGDLEAYSYIRSQYVFTNPFTGHINVQLQDKDLTDVQLEFFDFSNKKIFDLPAPPLNSFVIDKRNFQNKGVFKFNLIKGTKVVESGYITIY